MHFLALCGASFGRHGRSAIQTLPRATVVATTARHFANMSTPRWRERQGALNAAIQHQALLNAGPPPTSSRTWRINKAEKLVREMRIAAKNGKPLVCLLKAWALKDLSKQQPSLREALDYRDPQKRRTILHVLAQRKYSKPLTLLLELSASAWLKDYRGQTALHLAAISGCHRTCKQLLVVGRAQVDARDQRGRTPLHLVKVPRMAKLFTRFGANAFAEDQEGNAAAKGENEYRSLQSTLAGYMARRHAVDQKLHKVKYFKSPLAQGAKLPSHIVAPRLMLTPVGYCPVEDGKVVQLKRGIRYNKRRPAPSTPAGIVNWYSPRG
eukprot:NODE_10888_length_1322_cov_9.191632.p1 GENE.NODE_10888_length_1322_cov_9.191632~~NODE_10888_length_1322_cov_9.191632.p1  ORF type:complete len:324 (-),score=39.77 NODE_10888_length_1322_cov_9.191632:260-1231(-)